MARRTPTFSPFSSRPLRPPQTQSWKIKGGSDITSGYATFHCSETPQQSASGLDLLPVSHRASRNWPSPPTVAPGCRPAGSEVLALFGNAVRNPAVAAHQCVRPPHKHFAGFTQRLEVPARTNRSINNWNLFQNSTPSAQPGGHESCFVLQWNKDQRFASAGKLRQYCKVTSALL